MSPQLRRDFIPRMHKLNAKDAIRIVRDNEMNADDALRINGVHLTEDDIQWLNEPHAKYTLMHNPAMGTITVLKLRFK